MFDSLNVPYYASIARLLAAVDAATDAELEAYRGCRAELEAQLEDVADLRGVVLAARAAGLLDRSRARRDLLQLGQRANEAKRALLWLQLDHVRICSRHAALSDVLHQVAR